MAASGSAAWRASPKRFAISACRRAYDLAGLFSRFIARVGVDDEVRGGQKQANEVLFEIWGDGRLLWKSPPIHSGDAAMPVSIEVSGVKDLALKALPGRDGYNSDHADWLEARVTTATR